MGDGEKKEVRKKSTFREYAEAIVTALLLALLIRAFVVQAFKIPTGSMLSTLQIGDYLLVNKFLYGTKIPFSDDRVLVLREPERGDIVVFKFPRDPSRDFIKRVIGTPGDEVAFRGKKVYIDGEPIDEPYARYDEYITERNNRKRDHYGPKVVPEGKYFVMGDNRDNSEDSRYWGYVDLDDIRGKAFIIYWSWDKNYVPRLNRLFEVVR